MTLRTSQFVEDPQGVRKYDARLAMVIGDRAATFVQQVHYHAAWKEEQFGHREWRSSLSEWEKTFPYWSVDTIKRIIKECRNIGVLKARKGVFQGRKAVWFSLDYTKIEELGLKGIELVKEAQKEVDSRRKVQIAPTPDDDEECILHSPEGANCTDNVVQNAHHLLEPSTTASSTRANGSGSASLRSPNSAGSVPTKSQQLRERVRQKHLSTLEKRINGKHSIQSLELRWEIMVSDRFGKDAPIPFTGIDKKNSKVFFTWCEKARTEPIAFLQWCVDNWNTLRDRKLTWADLGKVPSFKAIFNLRDRFLDAFRHGGLTGDTHNAPRKKEVYTDISQVPTDHPQFKQIKILIETKGRAEA